MLNDDETRSLEALARAPDGCAEAALLANGLTIKQLSGLVIDGLATLGRRRTNVGGRRKAGALYADHRGRPTGDRGMTEPPRRFRLHGVPTRSLVATSSGTPVDSRSPASTAARPRSRRGERTCSRPTRAVGSPSISHLPELLGKGRRTDDGQGEASRSCPLPDHRRIHTSTLPSAQSSRATRRRLPLSRLACGVTRIAGAFALGFQGNFLSRLFGFCSGLPGDVLGGLTDRFLLRARGLSCAGCLAGVTRLAVCHSGCLPFHDRRVIRSRPRLKLLQGGLLSLRSRAQPLIEIVAILEPTHRSQFPFVVKS
jgi:hypothetical protein